MSLTLYNTLTKHEEEFTPRDDNRVSMYTCGPTVYGRPHVGNYASFLMADLLRRWLQFGHGYDVTHVKNITDVGHLVADADEGDDKIERQAEKEQRDPLEIAKMYEEQYLEDEKALNMIEPEARPRATETIPEMLSMIKELMKNGHAYELDDGVYFSVTTCSDYGKLSGNTLDKLEAGARVGIKEGKKHPADFALWKKCVGENAKHMLRWNFETGERVTSTGDDPAVGFPGWHIECSAMSKKLLGEQIDIHTGGEDNIFPHHECEIAQSESVSGKKPFVTQWIHRRRIQLGDEKMSKSLGNVLSIPDIIAQGYDPLDLRYYLLSVHYRTNLKFTDKGLDDAKKARRKIVEWMKEVSSADDVSGDNSADESIKKFSAAMNSDLNTSDALAVIFDAMSDSRNEQAIGAYKNFATLVRDTFGCFTWSDVSIPDDVQQLVDERKAARDAKDFAASDALRDAIAAKGFLVKDTADGQTVTAM